MTRQLTTAVSLVLALAAIARAQSVIYVDQNAVQTPSDGETWASAFVTLQEALEGAGADDVIRVADGIYLPTQQLEIGVARTETFGLIDGVTVEGGYAGYGAPDPDARDVALYETVLSGDIGVEGDVGDNCYHVAVVGEDVTAVLDGVTITAGNADGAYPRLFGGGVFGDGGNVILVRCTFRGNTAQQGGAVNVNYGQADVVRCVFRENSAVHVGGGIRLYGCDTVLESCDFIQNSATCAGGAGATSGQLTVTGCTFTENTAKSWGGGLVAEAVGLIASNCAFLGNSAGEPYFGGKGGGLYCEDYTNDLALTNCVFSGNVSSEGGGMWNCSVESTVANCVFAANSAGTGGALTDYSLSTLAIRSSIFCGNSSIVGSTTEGAAIIVTYSCAEEIWEGEGNIGANPLFVDADGADDVAGTIDDNLRLQAGSPCIDAGDSRSLPVGGAADLDGWYRRFDDPMTIDTGVGVAPIVDMGAYEYGSTQLPLWGDLNCDGVRNAFDIDPFVAALAAAENYATAFPGCHAGLADCNGDGVVNAFDVDEFVVILVGGR